LANAIKHIQRNPNLTIETRMILQVPRSVVKLDQENLTTSSSRLLGKLDYG